MDKRALGKRKRFVPTRKGEVFFEREEIATTAREKQVGRERLEVFKFIESHFDASLPNRKRTVNGGGGFANDGVGKFRIVVDMKFNELGFLGVTPSDSAI